MNYLDTINAFPRWTAATYQANYWRQCLSRHLWRIFNEAANFQTKYPRTKE